MPLFSKVPLSLETNLGSEGPPFLLGKLNTLEMSSQSVLYAQSDELSLKLAASNKGMDVIIATNVFAGDVHIGHRGLTRILFQGGMELLTTRNGIHIDSLERHTTIRQQGLCLLAMRAVRLGENHNVVALDQLLDLSGCSGTLISTAAHIQILSFISDKAISRGFGVLGFWGLGFRG